MHSPIGVKAVFKPARTLRQTLMRVKTRIPEERKRGVVYEVPCKGRGPLLVWQSTTPPGHNSSPSGDFAYIAPRSTFSGFKTL